ncbi:RtcB family protein [Pseudonocardia sp. MH-G8]|uniref:RtcB family protein n=1 Tax=Pseudonocardia sp. MH-G8 TaxID=1854588 RepID=UPI000BA0ED86|nr:RtcB family protein [Pseudonocardia sp. MH-G8]OZM79107.1 RNA-splicing ligase RtcB [Pseudonocardia sp. MH-G8]
MEQIAKGLLSWASILEDATREQALQTVRMPFVRPHVALMPDAHLGMGSTVGSVIPTVRAVMPASVGVDIGCGMAAVRTQLTKADVTRIGRLAALREAIEAAVPVSKGGYNRRLTDTAAERVRELETLAEKAGFDPASYVGNWRLQLGTLGSGNHFVEVCLDEVDRLWVFLHSGSRGVGNRIAQRHIRVAQQLCEKWWIPLPHRDLAYLPEGVDEFWHYIRELRWAQRFALLNRAEMLDRVVGSLAGWAGREIERAEDVQCHHNYTEREEHGGGEVWLTRKGAIDASPGRPGLIPGSMGTRSYVVSGLGNAASFHSAPHGAGRSFSRRAARERFTVAQLTEAMAGIEWRAENAEAFLDEIPGAYKDVDQIMEDAKDLVSVEHTLRQILNVKGD